MSAKVLRGRWASVEDALNLVAELERRLQTVKWDVDADQVLRSIMWASPEQVMLARTYGPNELCWHEHMAVLSSRTIRVSRIGEEGVKVFNCLLPSR